MVVILLATYNGEKYVAQLIASVHRQTHRDWRLVVHDDGSDDRTRCILSEFARRDARISLLEPDSRKLGPAGNFGALMRHALSADARYVCFADQDDVWLPEKIDRQLHAIRQLEDSLGRTQPLLVHSDLIVTDAVLNTVARSFTKYAGLAPRTGAPFRRLLTHNFVTGGATLINRPLLECAAPVPNDAVMHDWWLALCAAAVGRIEFLPEQTVLYRQHADNVVGATSLWSKPLRLLCSRTAWQAGMHAFRQSIAQASALRRRLEERNIRCHPGVVELLDGYCRAFEQPLKRFERIGELRRIGVPASGLFRGILTYGRTLAMGRSAPRKAA